MSLLWQAFLDTAIVRIFLGSVLIVQAGAMLRYVSFFRELNVRLYCYFGIVLSCYLTYITLSSSVTLSLRLSTGSD